MVRLLQCAWLSLVLAGAVGERTRRRRRQLTTTPAPTSAPTSYFSYGNPSCPCIDTNVTNGTTLTVLVGDDAFEYPGDYGSAVCKAHDMGLGDCVGSAKRWLDGVSKAGMHARARRGLTHHHARARARAQRLLSLAGRCGFVGTHQSLHVR